MSASSLLHQGNFRNIAAYSDDSVKGNGCAGTAWGKISLVYPAASGRLSQLEHVEPQSIIYIVRVYSHYCNIY